LNSPRYRRNRAAFKLPHPVYDMLLRDVNVPHNAPQIRVPQDGHQFWKFHPALNRPSGERMPQVVCCAGGIGALTPITPPASLSMCVEFAISY
jgi:hypothetical protein